jgi:hypothetical protein
MKTINFKNVVVVAMNNCALITNNDKKVSTVMNATDNTVASLQVMKAFLQSVPTNEELVEEPYQLVLGEKSAIKGFATGTHLQYIRTGANATGKEFTEEQFELIKEVATLLAERGLNVKVTTDKFISYKDKQGRAIIDFAWNTLKLEISKANEQAQQKPQRPVAPAKQTAVVDPRVAKLQELMTKALDEGDFDKYDMLEERLNRLQAPVAPVEETNEVEVPNEEEVEDPTAGSDEIEL